MSRTLAAATLCAWLSLGTVAHAQGLRKEGVYWNQSVPVADRDRETKVFIDHTLVVLPPTYIHVKRPDPSEHGFYAWKMTFNGRTSITLVLRSDTALTAKDDRSVLRATALYLCRDSEQPMLDCTTPVRSSVRRMRDHIELDITDLAIAKQLRASRPSILYRQLIEPGGRFMVDETGVIVP
ncbi:MAG: hypothetical protein IBJ03_09750 [Gemmatimonadaceae bacterium]|nr:hypothetical protein [Gemmatimonadaceae bacterium]